MADLQVAQTILKQLGGRRFQVMTGAKNFIGGDNYLSFRLKSNFASNGINYVLVTLNAQDTYDVDFSRIRARKLTPVSSKTGVYFDQLQSVFTRETGLNTSLGTMGLPASEWKKFDNRHED